MRLAFNARELRHGFDTARNEAEKAFGDPAVYLEKYLERPRHIEFQIVADTQGASSTSASGVLHPAAAQKVMEESPSVALSGRAARGDGGAPRSRPRARSST